MPDFTLLPAAEGTAAQQIKLTVLAIRTCSLPLGGRGFKGMTEQLRGVVLALFCPATVAFT